MMSAESRNNVFGYVRNPFNTGLTAGGSTGGEGALIASRGSMMGFGTDIAGSVRMPALCCGIYSLKVRLQHFRRAFADRTASALGRSHTEDRMLDDCARTRVRNRDPWTDGKARLTTLPRSRVLTPASARSPDSICS